MPPDPLSGPRQLAPLIAPSTPPVPINFLRKFLDPLLGLLASALTCRGFFLSITSYRSHPGYECPLPRARLFPIPLEAKEARHPEAGHLAPPEVPRAVLYPARLRALPPGSVSYV